MDETASREYCSRCGMEVFPFSKKYSVSSGAFFCVKCAEQVDREYLVKHSCSVCKRLLKSGDVKLVLPSKLYGDGRLPLADRLICTQCYKSVASKSMDRRSFRQRMQQVRANIRKGIAHKQAQAQYA